LRVLGCERVTVVAACRRLLVSSCADATFFVFCATNPVVSGDNRNCLLAPYNTAYPELPAHLRRAGLPATAPNLWHAPLDTTTLAAPADSSPPPEREFGSAAAGLLPPQHFATLAVPVRSARGPGVEAPPLLSNQPVCPFGLPPAYAHAVAGRLAAASELTHALGRALVDAAKLQPAPGDDADDGSRAPRSSEGAHRALEEALRAHFADWLGASGQLREVLDLAALDRAQFYAATEPAPESNGAMKP
jgi:hypothetical protein